MKKFGYLWGFILLSQAVALVSFLACQLWLHSNPFGFYANLVISVGGMIFGLFAGAGVYPGVKLSGTKPGMSVVALVALATVLNVLFYHYCLYAIYAAVTGNVGFAEFMNATMGHAQMRLSASSDPSDIGKGGFGLLLLDMAWAAGFSILPFSVLGRQAHCEACGIYFTISAKRQIKFFDRFALADLLNALPGPSAERAEILMQLWQDPSTKPCKGGLMLTAERARCPRCGEQNMTEIISVFTGEYYKRVDSISYRWRQAASRRASSQPPQQAQADQPAPQPRGFGRKGLG